MDYSKNIQNKIRKSTISFHLTVSINYESSDRSKSKIFQNNQNNQNRSYNKKKLIKQ